MTLASQWQTGLVIQAWQALFKTAIEQTAGIKVFYEPYPTPESVSGLSRWVIMKREGERGSTGEVGCKMPYSVIICSRKDSTAATMMNIRDLVIDATTLNGNGRKSVQYGTATECFDIVYNGVVIDDLFQDGTKFIVLEYLLIWGR